MKIEYPRNDAKVSLSSIEAGTFFLDQQGDLMLMLDNRKCVCFIPDNTPYLRDGFFALYSNYRFTVINVPVTFHPEVSE